ncbi:transketolase C-terminal domain-containing protein [Actinoplanes sp. NPDC048796]|uniref:alpha-ketoacid dehydrogenase subunit beta n=1 Tax=unclassified Actinoplanes TaxID=2626549 RepID=UPI00340A68AC
MAGERVVEALNRGLHDLLGRDPGTVLLGEDVLDPYGGAFRATKGLSTRFPDQVLSTPISENGIVGVANGLALTGRRVLVEMMFGDFLLLAFDQIVNFAAKSVSMYGRRVPLRTVVRCPVGGGRGYGPTHSQNPQKHLIGVPHLALAEMSAFHDPRHVLADLLDRGEPAVFFEDKILYTQPVRGEGRIDRLWVAELPAGPLGPAVLTTDRPDTLDCLIVCPGGVAGRAMRAGAELLLRHELETQIIVPSRLWPFDTKAVLDAAGRAAVVCVVEDGPAGGGWGTAVAHELHTALWGQLSRPVVTVAAEPEVIPTAPHLEETVRVGPEKIVAAVREAVR